MKFRTVEPAADVVYQPTVDGGGLLIEVSSGAQFALDEVAAAMWNSLMAHHTTEAAVAELMDTYDVGRATLVGDVEELIGHLAGLGLVTPS